MGHPFVRPSVVRAEEAYALSRFDRLVGGSGSDVSVPSSAFGAATSVGATAASVLLPRDVDVPVDFVPLTTRASGTDVLAA